MAYEAVQVLIRLGISSGRESKSTPRRSMDSLSQYVSRRSCKGNHDPLQGVYYAAGVQTTDPNNTDCRILGEPVG